MGSSMPDYEALGQQIDAYCKKYSIPSTYFLEIINDQKVVPMLRGKGMEYNAYLVINQMLDSSQWTVHKLNPNPQPGSPDQDSSVIHRRTNIRLGIESKSAVRGSMTAGARARLLRQIPHFKVKCHRSRSNIELAGTSNDRYRADAFDIIVTTPANALFKVGTIGDSLEMIDDQALMKILYTYYNVSSEEKLLKTADNDWRFVLPATIADKDGFVPRTPYVRLENDVSWLPISQLQKVLDQVVRQKWQNRNRSSRN